MNERGLVERYLTDRWMDAFEDEDENLSEHLDAFLIVIEGMEDHEFQALNQEETVTL